MRSWWMRMNDSDVDLELRDVPVPRPGPHQVLVRMHAAALNRGEFVARPWAARQGRRLEGDRRRRRRRGRRPSAPGVRASGPATASWAGAPVPSRSARSWTRARRWPCRPALSWEEAASIPLTFLVSYDMLVLQGRLAAGEWLLINGVSLRRRCGIPPARQDARREGHRDLRLRRQARRTRTARTGRPVVHAHQRFRRTRCWRRPDIVAPTSSSTPSAAPCSRRSVAAMAFEGRLATVGYVDGVLQADLDLAALHAKRLTVFGVSNKLRSKEQRASTVTALRRRGDAALRLPTPEAPYRPCRRLHAARRGQGLHGGRHSRRQDRATHDGIGVRGHQGPTGSYRNPDEPRCPLGPSPAPRRATEDVPPWSRRLAILTDGRTIGLLRCPMYAWARDKRGEMMGSTLEPRSIGHAPSSPAFARSAAGDVR